MPRATKASDASKSPAKKAAAKAAPASEAAAQEAGGAKSAGATAPKGPAPKKKAAAPKKKKAPAKASAPKASASDAPAPEAPAAEAPASEDSAAEAPAAEAPAPDEASAGTGDDDFLEAQRALLLEERESHTRQAAGLRAEAEQLAEERDPGDVQFDEESGQGDTMNVERERDLALSAQALQQVQEIDAALQKIDKGTYGLCERCGQPIPKERLQALPWAALDVGCKSMGFARR